MVANWDEVGVICRGQDQTRTGEYEMAYGVVDLICCGVAAYEGPERDQSPPQTVE